MFRIFRIFHHARSLPRPRRLRTSLSCRLRRSVPPAALPAGDSEAAAAPPASPGSMQAITLWTSAELEYGSRRLAERRGRKFG